MYVRQLHTSLIRIRPSKYVVVYVLQANYKAFRNTRIRRYIGLLQREREKLVQGMID